MSYAAATSSWSVSSPIGNLVGSYNDLQDLMALAATGAVTLHTQKYALDDFQ